MYKKFLVIASKQDKAGMNIINNLDQFRKNPVATAMQSNAPGFDIYLREETIISDENLDLERINKYDFIIFASKHQSEQPNKTLSIHTPGNWRRAFAVADNSEGKLEAAANGRKTTGEGFGGKSGKVCPTSALFLKQSFEILNKNKDEANLNEYDVAMEATHHGPLIEKPCMFIEIGSHEEQWTDRRAGFVIAKTIRDAIDNFKENPYREIAIGIGGPHYCPNFNKIQLNSNIAISHVIQQYVMPITEEMVKEAIAKTEEEIDFAVVDWKGLGTSEQRQEVINILEKNYISWKRTSDIDK